MIRESSGGGTAVSDSSSRSGGSSSSSTEQKKKPRVRFPRILSTSNPFALTIMAVFLPTETGNGAVPVPNPYYDTDYDGNQDDFMTLYRGVHTGHPDFANALLGMAFPRGTNTSSFDIEVQNGGGVTGFTSWSMSRSVANFHANKAGPGGVCLLYTSPSPRDATLSRMPSSA